MGPFVPPWDSEYLLLEQFVILLMLPVHQASISNLALPFGAQKWDCLVVREAQSKPFGFVKDREVSAGNFQRILNKLIIRAFGCVKGCENSEKGTVPQTICVDLGRPSIDVSDDRNDEENNILWKQEYSIRLTCCNSSFIPLEVKDSSFAV